VAASLAYYLAPSSSEEHLSALHRDPRRAKTDDASAPDARYSELHHPDDDIAATAFDAIVRAYYPTLCASAESYLGDPSAAEELTDAVFARVWERRQTLTIRTTIAAYLFGAVRNAARNALAKRYFAERRGTQAIAVHEPPGMSEPVPPTDAATEDAERRAMVWRAVAALPERARAIITLRWRMQLDWDEIADAIGMTANAVQVQHSRALARLRRDLPALRGLL
jgi:RNA polymerase sigma-70 factor (ECF subfamily)